MTTPLPTTIYPIKMEFIGAERQCESHAAAVERAREKYLSQVERIKSNTRLTDEGKAEEIAALDAPLRTVEQAAIAYAQKLDGYAKQAELLANGMEDLSTSDLKAAESRAWIIREDCQMLDADELAGRARAAIAAQDKVLAWLYRRYLAQRIKADTAVLQRGGDAHTTARARAATETLRPIAIALDEQFVNEERQQVLSQVAEIRRMAARLEVASATRQWELMEQMRASGRFNGF